MAYDTKYNTIHLMHGEITLTNDEFKKFNKGDSIYGYDTDPEIVKTWSIEQESEAKKELAKYRCSYKSNGHLHYIEEYSLDYCLCDEDGEFVEGSDFELAKEI